MAIDLLCRRRAACGLLAAIAVGTVACATALGQPSSGSQGDLTEYFIAQMQEGARQMTISPTVRDEMPGPFTKAYQLKSELDEKKRAYERSETDLRQALEAAIDQIPDDGPASDFYMEREALAQLELRTQRLATDAEMLISKIEQHRRVGGVYLTALTSATPTYSALAQQFRQYAKEEPYEDRREDYLVLASVFDQLGQRFQTAPTLVTADVNAIDELYPYLKSTHLLLKRTYGVLSVLPSESHGTAGSELDEQLREFVKTFNGFRQEIRKLNERLGGQTHESAPPPAENYPNDQTASYFSTPSGDRSAAASRGAVKSSYAAYHPPTSFSRPSATNELRATPSAWSAAERPRKTHILAFHLPNGSSNDMVRREAYRANVQEGDVISVAMASGAPIIVRVIREMPSVSSRTEVVWLAEVIQRSRPGNVQVSHRP